MSGRYKAQVIKTLLQTAHIRLNLNNKKNIYHPTILEFMMTSKCNCRCRMCNIWNKKHNADLSLDEIKKLFKDPLLVDLKTITLTGGEPFLRDDIIDICRVISSNCSNLIQLYISTNGFKHEFIYQKVKYILKAMPHIMRLRIGISFDHIGIKHDKVRGKQGIYENAITLIEKLRTIPDKRLYIQGNFTIAPYNVYDLKEIYDYFNNMNLKIFWFPIMVSSNFYENDDKVNDLTFDNHAKSKLMDFICFLMKKDNSLSDYYYYSNLLKSLINGKRAFPCTAGLKFLLVNSEGDIYPCYVIPKEFKLGNIKKESLVRIWHSRRAQKIRANLKNCETCHYCIQWYDGYAISDDSSVFLKFVLSHPLRIAKQLFI